VGHASRVTLPITIAPVLQHTRANVPIISAIDLLIIRDVVVSAALIVQGMSWFQEQQSGLQPVFVSLGFSA